MAEDLLIKIEEQKLFQGIERKKNFSKQRYLISLDKQDWLDKLKDLKIQLEEDITDHLYQQYGCGAIEIMNLIVKEPKLSERIVDENDFIKAEILYILRHELTPHLIDVFRRRTEMSLFIDHRKQIDVAKKVADIMAKEYSWSEEKKRMEIQHYLEYIKKTVSFI